MKESESDHDASDLESERTKVGEGVENAAGLQMSNCHWTSRAGLGESVWQGVTCVASGRRSPVTSEVGGPWSCSDQQRTSRGSYCVCENHCQLVLDRTYAEPVTPLGRQRDSAAAVRRGRCSLGIQRDPRSTEVERHLVVVASRVSYPRITQLSSFEPSPV